MTPSGSFRLGPMIAPAIIGVLFAVFGHPVQGALLLGLAGTVLVAAICGVRIDRALAAGAERLAEAVSAAISSAVGLALVVATAPLRLARRDVLRGGRLGRRTSTTWHAARRDSVGAAARPFSDDRLGATPQSIPRALLGSVPGFVGICTLVLAANLGIGLAWEQIADDPVPDDVVQDPINFTGSVTVHHDPRADLPAMADAPWREEYFGELQRTPSGYWPFTESKPRDFQGDYVNIVGWARRSYEPAGVAPGAAPRIWMFGGSTTWGEGQRDEHTIASALARLGEAAGTPVHVENYGQRGWTHFQEMILFEQLLAAGPPPDLVVFYDGANEINAQSLGAKGVPSHTLADAYAELLTGSPIEQAPRAADDRPNALVSAWRAYADHSAIHKLVSSLDDELFGAAGASGLTGSSRLVPDQFDKTDEDARNAVDVYERGRDLTMHLADRYDVPARFYWQPVLRGPAERTADALISSPTINISDLLADHADVFIDGGHTNERGATLVADRLWDDIGPWAATWFDDHPDAAGALPPVPTATSSTTSTTAATSVTPPSNLDLIDRVESTINGSGANGCGLLEANAPALAVRAATPDEVAAATLMAAAYLDGLARSAPPDLAPDAAILAEGSARLPGLVGGTSIDPERPFLQQLPVATDARFNAAFDSVFARLQQTCDSVPR